MKPTQFLQFAPSFCVLLCCLGQILCLPPQNGTLDDPSDGSASIPSVSSVKRYAQTSEKYGYRVLGTIDLTSDFDNSRLIADIIKDYMQLTLDTAPASRDMPVGETRFDSRTGAVVSISWSADGPAWTHDDYRHALQFIFTSPILKRREYRFRPLSVDLTSPSTGQSLTLIIRPQPFRKFEFRTSFKHLPEVVCEGWYYTQDVFTDQTLAAQLAQEFERVATKHDDDPRSKRPLGSKMALGRATNNIDGPIRTYLYVPKPLDNLARLEWNHFAKIQRTLQSTIQSDFNGQWAMMDMKCREQLGPNRAIPLLEFWMAPVVAAT